MNSPVFNKVKEAVEIVNLARKLEDHALSPHSVLMQGRDDTHLHVDYVPETGGITLAFVGALMTAHTVCMCLCFYVSASHTHPVAQHREEACK
jgi:hypothetical protein